MNLPDALKTVLRYANARPTEKTWRRVVLGPAANLFLTRGAEPPDLPPYGVESLEALQRTLDQFRHFLLRWIELRRARSLEGKDLRETLKARSKLRLADIGVDPKTKRIFPVYATEAGTFDEMLYSELRLALEQVSPAAIHRCQGCGTFFYDPSKRKLKYCSKRCRNAVMVKRYRTRNPEKHREYQRELMRQRRTQEKGSS